MQGEREGRRRGKKLLLFLFEKARGEREEEWGGGRVKDGDWRAGRGLKEKGNGWGGVEGREKKEESRKRRGEVKGRSQWHASFRFRRGERKLVVSIFCLYLAS